MTLAHLSNAVGAKKMPRGNTIAIVNIEMSRTLHVEYSQNGNITMPGNVDYKLTLSKCMQFHPKFSDSNNLSHFSMIAQKT